jgi:hypothetical protein
MMRMMRRVYTSLLLVAMGFFIISLSEAEASAEEGEDASEDPAQPEDSVLTAGDVLRDLQVGRT